MSKRSFAHPHYGPPPRLSPQTDRIDEAKRRASALASQNKVDEAIDLLSRELLKEPTRTDILLAIGKILVEASRWEAAAEALAVLRVHLPGDGEIPKMLGVVFSRLGENRRAVEQWIAAHALRPLDVEIPIHLAQAYERLHEPEQAETWVRVALKISPNKVDLLCYAASILHASGKPREAKALLLDSKVCERPEIRLLEAMLMPIIPESFEEILGAREHLHATLDSLALSEQIIQGPEKKIIATAFQLGYQGQRDRDLVAKLSNTILHLCPELDYVSPALTENVLSENALTEKPPSTEKITVGFVSSHLRAHAVGRVLNRFMSELDRARFQVILFELPGADHAGQEVARTYADKTVPMPTHLDGCRKAIEAEKPDILVFPDFVLQPLSDLLAYSRLAKVQCTTWGHPGTSGRPSIDYWITCEDWDPPGNEDLYTETLVRLESPPMIASSAQIPENILSRDQLGLPEGRIYGCAQSLFKIHPKFDAILAEILTLDQEAHLVLIAASRPNWVYRFQERFQRAYPEVWNRIIILDYLSSDEYVSLLTHCSVGLDPTEFGGANTTMDAFTVGLPVITWPGEQLRNRQTYSYYRRMGLTDLVVDSKDAYVRLAVKVATDQEYRRKLLDQILEKNKVIFETTHVARQLENFFERAVADAKKK